MAARRNSARSTLSRQAAEIAIAAPQVIVHRLVRMAMAGATPSARDRAEFALMGREKVQAFGNSLQTMAWQTMVEQQRMAMSMATSFWFPWTSAWPNHGSVERQIQQAGWAIASKGLAPIHRAATANAKRLSLSRNA